MSTFSSAMEEAALRTVVPSLEAEGFQVFVHPSRQMLPAFLSKFRPDAIAIRPDKKLALEVMGGSASSNDQRHRTRLLRAMFAKHPDWELRVVYVPGSEPVEIIPVSSREAIESYLVHVERSFEGMGPAAALLAAWAAFEAAARALSPEALGRPQPAARVIEALAGQGHITPDEADLVRHLSRMRAQIAHGRLDLVPAREQVGKLIGITREMLSQPI